jgi:hypothetical protein
VSVPELVAFEVSPIVDALRDDGYVIVEDVLDPGRVAQTKAELEEILTPVPTGPNAFEGFGTKRTYGPFRMTRGFDGGGRFLPSRA